MSVRKSLTSTFRSYFMSYALLYILPDLIVKAIMVFTLSMCALGGTVSAQTEAALHGKVLMKVVRWRPSCQTQQHFTRLHLSWFCRCTQCTAGREGNKGEKPFYSTMPRCLYTTPRLFNWNVTRCFDKDIELQSLSIYCNLHPRRCRQSTELKGRTVNQRLLSPEV